MATFPLCNQEVFLNNPSRQKNGYLTQTTNIASFEALLPVMPQEHPLTRGWDNEAFDAVNEFFWGMENGIVLELGGLDGQRFSVSADFLPFQWHRILIEASPSYTKFGVERSPDATYIAAAVCNLKNVHYVLKSNGAINGIGEFMSPDFLQTFHNNVFAATNGGSTWSSENWTEWSAQHDTTVVEVPCISLNTVFECLNTTHINFFVLDVEGGEMSVLHSINFDRVTFDVICVEVDPRYRPEGYASEVSNFLQRHGYVKEFDRGRNSWFRRETFQPKRKEVLMPKQNMTLVNLLESSCGSPTPRFVSFAFTHVGRWSSESLQMAAKLVYSSLVRAHNCAPILYVYTNDPQMHATLPKLTTMNTRTNIIVVVQNVTAITSRGYDKFRDLSMYKMDVVREHLIHGEHIIWIDLDTLVFVDLSPMVQEDVGCTVGWQHGKRGLPKELVLKMFSGVNVPPKYDSYGDLWSLNLKALDEIASLYKEQTEKNITRPMYDVQGYMSILMSQGSTNIKILQQIMPNHSFGFQCSNFTHPNVEFFKPKIMNQELHCPDVQGIGLGSKVGSISFTSPTFKRTILSDPVKFSSISDPEVREWFKRWFFL